MVIQHKAEYIKKGKKYASRKSTFGPVAFKVRLCEIYQ